MTTPTRQDEITAERDAIALLGENPYTLARLNIRAQIALMSDRDSFRLYRVERYSRTYSTNPEAIGSIEVEYYCPTLRSFNHALFSVSATGDVLCLAN